MTQPTWRAAVIDYIRSAALPADKFGHQPRLYALTTAVGQGMAYDDDILFAAAWMHDLGVFIGHRPSDPAELAKWDHVPYTISRARELLAGWRFPAGKLDAVAEVIRTHQPSDKPSSVEGVILRDADILEQLGAMGAIRALVKVGRDTRYPTYSSVIPVLRKALDKLPSELQLESSRQLAVSRIEALTYIINAVENEANGMLF